MVGHSADLISDQVVPFGGVKQSGSGAKSRLDIEEYLETQYFCTAIT